MSGAPDPELDAQVEKFERRHQPRSRAEIEADIDEARTVWSAKVDRFNHLRQVLFETEAELLPLRGEVLGYARATADLEWEHFRRLQLDGVLIALPTLLPDAMFERYTSLRVGQPTNDNHKNDGDVEKED